MYYSDAYILMKGTIIITWVGAHAAAKQADGKRLASNIQKLCTIRWPK